MKFDSSQLDDAFSRLLEGDMDREEFADLEAYLVQSSDARKRYLEYIELHNALDTEFRLPVNPVSGRGVISMDRVLRRSRRKQVKIAVGIAASIVLIVSLMLGLKSVPPRIPVLAFNTAPGTQFTLTHSKADKTPEGMVLEKGSRLRISQGTIELIFNSGVKSIVTAPADLTLHDDDLLYLNKGTAWFYVPKEAIGFQVKTRDVEVVDLGTEFGVRSSADEEDEVHVFSGKVQVTALMGQKEQVILTAGDARSVRPYGKFVKRGLSPETFLRKLPRSLPYLHWSFDQAVDGSFPAVGFDPKLKQSAARPKEASPGSLQTEGRYGKAVSFTAKAGQELITGHPGFDPKTPLSICYWVKIPPHANQHHQIPLMAWAVPDTPTKQASKHARWEFHAISSPTGTGKLNHRASCAGWSQGSVNIGDGEWHHIATVFTGRTLEDDRPEVLFYIDGVPDPVSFSHPDAVYSYTDYSGIYVSQPIVFGTTSLFVHPPHRMFGTSQLDEVFMIQGALTVDQINHLKDTNELP